MSVPPGPHLLSDVIISSPILAGDGAQGEGGEASGVPGGSGGDFEFGVDPTLDPELAMVCPHLVKCLFGEMLKIPQQALRMSLQEEQARQDAEAAAAPGAVTSDATTNPVSGISSSEAGMDEDDEEAQLAAALALSQGEDVEMVDEEEDEIQQAMRLSNQDANDDHDKK